VKKKTLISIGLGIFLGLLGLAIFGERGLLKLQELRAERKALEQKSSQLKKENDKLTNKTELLKENFEYLKRLVREKLGMIRPDEVIIEVPEPGATINQPVPEKEK